jgi:hypothetical protein
LANLGIRDNLGSIDNGGGRGPQVVALSCKMVGGGSDGSLDLCGRVCLIDDSENIIFHTYVKPTYPVTNYRLIRFLINYIICFNLVLLMHALIIKLTDHLVKLIIGMKQQAFDQNT